MSGQLDIPGITVEQCKVFEDEGLEPKDWVPVIKDKLQVDNITLLKHKKIEDIRSFLEGIDNEAHKGALEEVIEKLTKVFSKEKERLADEEKKKERLAGEEKKKKDEEDAAKKIIEDKEDAAKKAEAKRIEKEKEKNDTEKKERDEATEKARIDAQQAALEAANQATNKTKKDSEAGIKKHNKDSPENFGKYEDKDSEMRQRIVRNLPGEGSSVGERTNWTAAETVRKIQGGSLCKGIYLTNDIDELVKERQAVIEVDADLEFKGASTKSGETFKKEFTSQKMTDTFENNTDKSSSTDGGSASASASVSYFGVSVSVGGSFSTSKSKSKEQEEELSHRKQETFMATVHYERVAVKSIDLSPYQIRITSHAVTTLKEIEQKIRGLKYKSKGHFRKFFEEYGSHATHGVVELGGILMSTATHRGFKEEKRSKISDVTSKASETAFNVGFSTGFSRFGFGAKVAAAGGGSFSASEVLGKTEGKYEAEDVQNTDVSLKMIGGPEETYDKDAWRKGLVENSSLWRIIGRKSRPIPIWELLGSHKDEFENYSLLGNAMKNEWEELSTARDNTTYIILNKLRNDISLWQQMYKNTDQHDIVECIKDLAKIRNANIVGVQDWREEVLYLPDVQAKIDQTKQFIEQTSNGFEKENARTSLKFILRPIELIHKKYFPTIKDVRDVVDDRQMQSLDSSPFQISQLSKLSKALQTNIAEINRDSEDEVTKLRSLSLRLESTLRHFSTKASSFQYLVCLATLHVHGFNISEHYFEFFLGKTEIKEIIDALEKSLSGFESLPDDKAKQAYILSLALNSPTQKKETVQYMIDKMPGKVDQGLADSWAASQQLDNSVDFTTFQNKLSDNLSNTKWGEDLQALVQSLKRQFASVIQLQKDTKIHEFPTGVDLNDLDGEVRELLERLSLTEYYPQKITYDDIIMLNSDDLSDAEPKPKGLQDLPWYFMKQVIGLNSNAREGSVSLTNKNKQTEKVGKSLQPDKKPRNINQGGKWNRNWKGGEASAGLQGSLSNQVTEKVHPLDLICAVFLCADDFLRQELTDKMSKCQYAVPLILPTPVKDPNEPQGLMLYWALKNIARMFKTGNKTAHKTMVDFKCPLVSFLSYGDETSWKLKLLNKMLSPHQNTFWFEDLEGGSCEQKISKGMAEMAWYLPGGHNDDKFSKAVGFINVRGNSLDSSAVSDTLIKSSSVSVVFTDKVDEQTYDYLKSKEDNIDRIILVVLYKQENESEIEDNCSQLKELLPIKDENLIVYKDRNANFTEVFNALEKSLEMQMESNETSLSNIVAEVKTVKKLRIDDSFCHRGVMAAHGILNDLDAYNNRKPGSAKAIILPYQSDIKSRVQMGIYDKELCRQKQKKDEEVTEYATKVKLNKWKLQHRQLQGPISSTFMKFLQCILRFDKQDRKYFLQALKLGLNERSIALLQPLKELYQQIRLEKENDEKERKLDQLSEQLTHGSLGLEHFFREMAVLFENMVALKERAKGILLDDTLDALSTVMADMLLEGTAVEILDGDAVHSPVLWLKAVLHKVENSTLARIFKVCILGAQSCGKSTILNTAFGLNFPVSSGRCTRGAFMQLVRINEELQEKLKCDYLLVIDSEGLMARTLTDRSDYDNELATFVIGLSDLTLVIIKGEGNEMQDVLPIAIHVFLRMNKVGEQQACRFVHTQMGAVDVETASSLEIDAFVKLLDENTLAAAKDTEQTDRFTSFTDVLHYDKVHDNTYVPGLWDGTPPMGKTNVHYCARMQQLKNAILKRIEVVTTNSTLSTLTQFTDWLAEIWKAIKYENFVFSFKNVLAIEAYNKLTNIYDDKQWELKKVVRNQLKKEETILANEVKKITDQETAKSQIESKIANASSRVKNEIALKTKTFNSEIMNYFPCEHETGIEKECCKTAKIPKLQINLKLEFEQNIKGLRSALDKETTERMNALKAKLQADARIHHLGIEMDDILKERVRKLSKEQKSKDLTEDDIKEIFNKMWAEATGDIMQTVRQADEEVNIKNKIQVIVIKLLESQKIDHLYLEKLVDKDKPEFIQSFQIRENHIKLIGFTEVKGIWRSVKAGVRKAADTLWDQIGPSDCEDMWVKAQAVIASAADYYKFSIEGKEFVEKDAEQLFKEALNKVNVIKNDKVKVTDDFKVDLLMFIEQRAAEGYQKLHNAYRQRSSPKALLDDKKKSYLDVFMMQMGQGNLAINFCENALKEIVTHNVERRIDCVKLLHNLRIYCKHVFTDMKSLQSSIMVDRYKVTSEEEQFSRYYEYINRYESVVKDKMTQESIACFQRDNLLQELAKRELDDILYNVMSTAINDTVENLSDGTEFIETLFDQLSTLDYSVEKVVAYHDMRVDDKEQFGKLLVQHLCGPVREEVLKEITEWEVEKVLKEKDLTSYAFNEVVGCKERCPFCKVPCDNHSGGRTGGQHSATLHRPKGLGGQPYHESRRLVPLDCQAAVNSNGSFLSTKDDDIIWVPYKNYTDIYPDWDIKGESDPDVEKYWKWVFARHNKRFAERYREKPSDNIPTDWARYNRDDIKKDMKDHYHVDIDL